MNRRNRGKGLKYVQSQQYDFNDVVFGVFIVNFKYISLFFVSVVEQVNVCWDVSTCSIARLEGIYLSPCGAKRKSKLKRNL